MCSYFFICYFHTQNTHTHTHISLLFYYFLLSSLNSQAKGKIPQQILLQWNKILFFFYLCKENCNKINFYENHCGEILYFIFIYFLLNFFLVGWVGVLSKKSMTLGFWLLLLFFDVVANKKYYIFYATDYIINIFFHTIFFIISSCFSSHFLLLLSYFIHFTLCHLYHFRNLLSNDFNHMWQFCYFALYSIFLYLIIFFHNW